MLFSELTSDGLTYRITGHAPGAIGINDVAYHASLIVRPRSLHADWPVRAAGELDLAALEPILEEPPEVLLIGTGEVSRFPPRELRRELQRRELGVEIMDTAAACRTYNLIMAEGRDVAAALIVEPAEASAGD
ncbi:Mth938-like domain-containing protein [Thioalkalivibrio sp. AKL17]|uniref:Mth938-like domain-containing protein n=1 Tax=Thioalkalivibrio sp. AKL17 TaxID=1158160 RepID=UPI00037CAA54|nr:MTH938/NDUFAF3 family protein [Thioalkalivibrio sp. AKL17]